MLDGRDVARVDPADRDIAMVFQNYALYPHMTVFDNMAYALRIRGLARSEIRRRVDEAAALLGLGALLGRKPRELSGGQRQRVAMGRAIVREPKLFLFDEPLSNLDAKLRVQMRAEIRQLQRRLGVTSLYVTHDQVEAMTLGDRLLVLHQGRPVQFATPMEVFERPADTYVASFIGTPAMNMLPGTLARDGGAVRLPWGELPFADGPRPGAQGRKIVVGLRPEHARLDAADPGSIEMPVELVEPLGTETLVHGRLPDGELFTLKLPGGPPPGEQVRVALASEHLHVFDAETGLRLDPAGPRA